jgi:hypothetical protein
MGRGGDGHGSKRLPGRPAVANDRDEQQQAHDEVVAGDVRGQGGPGAGLVGRLPVGLGDPVAKQVAGEQDKNTIAVIVYLCGLGDGSKVWPASWFTGAYLRRVVS